MMNEHISEQDIQLAVLDSTQLLPELRLHLDQCAVCKARVKEYELLFTNIESLPKASFDFDVVDLVMPLLPEKKQTTNKVPLIIAAVMLAAGLFALPFFLFNNRIDGLWKTVSPWMMGLVAIVGVVFVAISLIDMYTNYRHQLRKLNFE